MAELLHSDPMYCHRL